MRSKIFTGKTENDWYEYFKKEVISKSKKALVYGGIHHMFTKYKQPIISNKKLNRFVTDRFGNYAHEDLGDKAYTIYFHSVWFDLNDASIPASDGLMDLLIDSIPKNKRNIGFDLSSTPMGNFTGESSSYSVGYEDFKLKDFVDEYIIQCKLKDYKSVRYIKNFIDKENIEIVQKYLPNPYFRDASVNEINKALRGDSNLDFHFRNALIQFKLLKATTNDK